MKKRKLEELYLSGEYPEKKIVKKEGVEDSGRQSVLRKKQPDRALGMREWKDRSIAIDP